MLSWKIGDVTVTRVVELTTASIGAHILPQATPELLLQHEWIRPFLTEDGKLVLSMHSLVISSEGRTILVDTCIGNNKTRNYPRWNQMQSSYIEDLAESGFPTGMIDTVLCTHMHVDHVGWNTILKDDRWVPTFPNARYLFSEIEWEYWRDEEQEFGPVIEDSVQPIFDNHQADLVKQDHRITDEVRLEPTPGHTPGHVSVRICSKGEEAIITGDMIHHPCQIAYPDWSTDVDWHREVSAETRKTFLKLHTNSPMLVIGTHFSGPTAGRIVRDGKSFRLDY